MRFAGHVSTGEDGRQDFRLNRGAVAEVKVGDGVEQLQRQIEVAETGFTLLRLDRERIGVPRFGNFARRMSGAFLLWGVARLTGGFRTALAGGFRFGLRFGGRFFRRYRLGGRFGFGRAVGFLFFEQFSDFFDERRH